MMRIAKYAALAASVLAASTMIASSAGARAPGIMYHRTFYSDATLTTQVGWYRDGCWNGNVVASPVQGVTSPYFTLEPIGECKKTGGGYD